MANKNDRRHTVTRTWFNKKKNQWVVKTYEYIPGKSRRGVVLVGKNGKINKKNVTKIEDIISKSTDYNAVEKRTLINDLKAYVKQKSKERSKLTSNGFFGHQTDTKVERYLVNLGYSAEQLADELNVSVNDVLNADNWKQDIFTVNGNRYKMASYYNGPLYEKVND